MNVTESIPDFGFSTELNEAHEAFGQTLGITAYVEAYEDVRFWTKEFKKLELEVTVQEISATGTANGKGTILKAVECGSIILGVKLLICIDSDYDYLLSKNTEIYRSDFCFQTYAYAIENYYYNPINLTELCFDAACVYQGFEKNHLERLLVNWSEYIYGVFLQYLDENTNELSLIKASIDDLTIDPTPYQNMTTHTLSSVQLENFSNKGLCSTNVFLYFRGHDLEIKVKKLAEQLVSKLITKKTTDIKDTHGDNSSNFIREFIKKKKSIVMLMESRTDFPTNHCYTLLQADIQNYKAQYTSF